MKWYKNAFFGRGVIRLLFESKNIYNYTNTSITTLVLNHPLLVPSSVVIINVNLWENISFTIIIKCDRKKIKANIIRCIENLVARADSLPWRRTHFRLSPVLLLGHFVLFFQECLDFKYSSFSQFTYPSVLLTLSPAQKLC